MVGKLPGDNRELGAGRGRKWGGQLIWDTAADAGMPRRMQSEWQRMVGFGCVQRPVWRCSVP